MGVIKLKLEVIATDTRKYESVNFGTYEAEFDIEEFLKSPSGVMVWEKLISNECGVTEDNRLAWLDGIQIRPRVRFGKPIPLEEEEKN